MVLVGRNWDVGSGYRYGFSRMEKDEETYGNNNAIDFGARIYDTRLGKWLSMDPKSHGYPSNSPYSYAINSPIMCIDLGGNDVYVTIERNPNGGGKITLTSNIYVTGVSAEVSAEAFNKEFKEWADNGRNVGFYTTTENGQEVTWEIEIQMNFVVATSEDVDRIKNAGPGTAAENLVESEFGVISPISGQKVSGFTTTLPGDPYEEYKKVGLYSVPQWQWGFRYTKIDVMAPAGVIIHEILHAYGLIDRYWIAIYQYTAEDGTVLEDEAKPISHVGFEDDIMGITDANITTNTPLISRHFANIGSYILNAATNLGDKFVLSRLSIDENDASNIPGSYTKDGITYSNPTVIEK